MTSDTVPACTRYFTEFLPALAGELLIDDLRDLNASLEIHVLDLSEPAWQIHIVNGRIGQVSQEGPGAPCRFALNSSTFLEIISGRLSAQEAFFNGDVDIQGDLELGLKLSTVLEPFFTRFPFRP